MTSAQPSPPRGLVVPPTFVPSQQTAFGWFENDVYTGLLMIALYVVVHRLRGVGITER